MSTIIRTGGGYSVGYDDGHTDGYNSGMTNGYNNGYNTAKLAGSKEQISIGATTTKDYKFIACNAFVVGNRVHANAGSVGVSGTYSGTQAFSNGKWGYVAAIDGDAAAYCSTTIYFDVKAGAKITETGGSNGDVVHTCYGFN